jgi:ubiquinone/menaquinone biosynthesis C-methylase UbiE
MIEDIFQEFERVLSDPRRKIGKSVLEIGAVPTSHSLLNLKAVSKASEKIGINLDGGESYQLGKPTLPNDCQIIKANANNMTCFQDNRFDTVLCNSMFEHDKYFWKTVSEIKRVAKKGALIVIGVPGYDNLVNVQLRTRMDKIRYFLIKWLKLERLVGGTPTFWVHNFPGDYYRFSIQAVKEAIFEGMEDVEVFSILIPPRIIGIGYNVK